MRTIVTIALIGAWAALEYWWWRWEKRRATQPELAAKYGAARRVYYLALVGLVAVGVWWASTCGWSPA
ncbi:MAG: hypothetical protein IPK53_01310 [bacterium]|nr:hypothetical protein [bacterium]MBK8127603.1 hypothetical protein [bacterium]